MAPAYATPVDLAGWLPGDVEVDEPGRLLARASELLDDTVRAPFTVVDGLPSDEAVATALREACCAQVRFWAEVSEEHHVAGMGDMGAGTSTGGVTILGTHIGRLPPELAPEARHVLSAAGLLTPVHAGGSS